MKSRIEIGRSRNARLNQARRHAKQMLGQLDGAIGLDEMKPHLDAEMWEDLRDLAGRISQCVHEANAYNNSLADSGTKFERDSFSVPGNGGEAPAPKPEDAPRDR